MQQSKKKILLQLRSLSKLDWIASIILVSGKERGLGWSSP